MTWEEKQESSSLLPYKYTIKLIGPERIYQLLHSISMSKKFEYNFTAENELADLRDRVSELEEENTLLKQSLEELIKVNTELTESIEDFNNENMQQEYQAQQVMQMQQTIETLNNEIENLRREVDYGQYDPSRNGRKPQSVMDEAETESLVNVLQELIESFKNMQSRYENEMQEFQRSFDEYKKNYEFALHKLEEDYKQKLNTLEPIIQQLTRKEDNLAMIEQKVLHLEEKKTREPFRKDKEDAREQLSSSSRHTIEKKQLESQIADKNRIIHQYQQLLTHLKAKFSEKL